jgi:HEAT repeat protein
VSLALGSILLAALGCSPSAEDIAKAVKSDNPVMREDGAKISQNYADEVVEAALLEVLPKGSEAVKLNAIESLAEIEATTANQALIERLSSDESPKVRRAAADALGRLKVKDGVSALIAYLQEFDANDRDQLAGVWALGNIGSEGLDQAAKESVLNTLVALRERTNDKYVRYQTTAALRVLK